MWSGGCAEVISTRRQHVKYFPSLLGYLAAGSDFLLILVESNFAPQQRSNYQIYWKMEFAFEKLAPIPPPPPDQ